MPWRQVPDPSRPGSGHDVPDHGGETVIPGYRGREGKAKSYIHERMSRDECERIQVAVGVALGGMPVERRAIGDGYSLLIPAEFFRDCIPGLKAMVAKAGRR